MSHTPVICRIFLSCASLCLAYPAFAGSEPVLRQQLFESDKAAALAGFDAAQKQACLKAFDSRYQSHYTLIGALAFDEPLSQGVYDRLFWKGEGSLHRGLAFTGFVTDSAGAKAGKLVCYYATTDYRLDFQGAYLLPLPAQGMADAAAPSLTLSSKE